MRKTKKLLAAVIAITMVFTLIIAVPASAADTTIGTSSDTFARFGSKASSIYGTQTYLGLFVKSALANRYLPYMRFDAEAAQQEAITAAPLVTLRITPTVINQLIPLTLYGIEDDAETPVLRKTGWTEATLNGTLATTLGLDDTANMTEISTYPATYAVNDVIEYDVTDYVKGQADGIFAFSLYSSEAMTATAANRFAASDSADITKHPVLYVYEAGSDAYNAYLDARGAALNEKYSRNFTLPTNAANGSTIAWTSSDESVIAISGGAATVTRGASDSVVTLTATATCGGESSTAKYTVTVPAERVGDTYNFASALDGTFRRAISSTTAWNGTSYRIIQASTNKRGMLMRFDTAAEDISDITYAELALTIGSVGSDNLEKDISVYPLHDVDADNMYKTGWTTENYNTDYVTALPDYLPDDRVKYNLSRSYIPDGGTYRKMDIGVTDYVKAQTDDISAFKIEVSGFSEAEAQFKIFGSGATDSANAPMLRVYYGDSGTVRYAADKLDVPDYPRSDFTLATAAEGADIAWASDSDAISITDGAATVIQPTDADAAVVLTATVTKGAATYERSYSVTVPAHMADVTSLRGGAEVNPDTTAKLRFMTKIDLYGANSAEYFGTFIIPQTIFESGSTDSALDVRYEQSVESGQSYSADLNAIAAENSDVKIYAWSYLKLTGVDDLLTAAHGAVSVDDYTGGAQ